MPLSPDDQSILSRLLSEALRLQPAQVEPWLAALRPAHQHLKVTLRQMLAAHRDQSTLGRIPDGARQLATSSLDAEAQADATVGPYRLIREIGQGGMGTVWLAERADGSFQRKVALKLPRLAWGAGLAERMARERDIGALLEHPNIARLYDAGVDALGRPYLALEYIDGQPLDVWCQAQAASVRDRLRLFLQVARAVAYAHGRLVVHRDLKPSNVLVTPDAQVHLLDFGIAKLLHEPGPADALLTQQLGQVLTPNYASPEQLKGETITVASDVYSLGVLLYELLTGHRPHASAGRSRAALEDAVLTEAPERASRRAPDPSTAKALRGDLDAILGKALQRQPDQRYATADALAADIERHLAGEPVLAQPDRIGYRLGKAIRRHRLSFATTVAVLAAIAIGSSLAIVQAQRATQSALRERTVKEFVAEVFRTARTGATPKEQRADAEALARSRFKDEPDLQAELLRVIAGLFGAHRLQVVETLTTGTLERLKSEGFESSVHLQMPSAPVPQIDGQIMLTQTSIPMQSDALSEQNFEILTGLLAMPMPTVVSASSSQHAFALVFLHRVIQREENPRWVFDELLRGVTLDLPTREFVQSQLKAHHIEFELP